MILALFLQIDIERDIRRLGAEDVAERDAAAARLVAAGEPAVEALQKALDDPDPEIVARATVILRAIRPSRLDSLFVDARAVVSDKSGERLDALVDEAKALSADFWKAAALEPGAGSLRRAGGLSRGTVDAVEDGILDGKRVLASNAEISVASGSVIVIDGSLKADSLEGSIVIATGTVTVTAAEDCIIIAGGGVETNGAITNSTVITPGPVSGKYVLESVVHAGKNATPQVLYGGVLLNCDGGSSAEYGMDAPRRIDADAVKAWFEPRIRSK